jgi:hypothetical protein
LLYSIFIFQQNIGLPIWEKNFDANYTSEKMQLYSSFFSAIHSFVLELVKKGSDGLKKLDLGENSVQLSSVPEHQIEIVTIQERSHEKQIGKLHKKIIKIIKNHKELFDWDAWSGDLTQFKVLDYDIVSVVKEIKGLVEDKSLVDLQKEFLDHIWNELPEMEKTQKEQYRKEILVKQTSLKESNILTQKLNLIDEIQELTKKIKDSAIFEQTQLQRKKIIAEIKNLKEKAQYFLNKANVAYTNISKIITYHNVHEIDLRDLYLALYSLSTKLIILGSLKKGHELKKIAGSLIERKDDNNDSIWETIKNLPNLSQPIESFLK